MTFDLLNKIIEENSIPKDVKLMSDSGWECGETDMDGIFYSKEDNVLIFTQHGDSYDRLFKNEDYELLYGYNKLCRKCPYLDELEICEKHHDICVGIHNIIECEYFERIRNEQ